MIRMYGLIWRSALSAAVVFLVGGCGEVGSSSDVKLGVPYHAQALGSLDCGPASVQMWADYDYSTAPPSQQEIANWMGGTCSGASEDAIAAAVNHFTNTDDAVWDFASPTNHEPFMARQITSIDNGTPVIAIIDFNHAGVINGGKWHEEPSWYQWDYTYFHDPMVKGNDYYTSSGWIQVNCPTDQICSQIISQVMIQGWSTNYSTYGDSVYDSSGGCCNQEYQY